MVWGPLIREPHSWPYFHRRVIRRQPRRVAKRIEKMMARERAKTLVEWRGAVIIPLLSVAAIWHTACNKGGGAEAPNTSSGGTASMEVIFPTPPKCEGEVCANIRTNRDDVERKGRAPFAVFFDGTLETESGLAFHDLHFEWKFGADSAPTAGDVWRHTGKKKNVAFGPIAGHVFTEPGDHPVTLIVSNAHGETAEQTVIVTVTDDWPSTRCYADIRNNGGDFSGCPLAEADGSCGDPACVDTSDLLTAVGGHLSTGSRLMFRRGDTFTAARDGDLRITQRGPGLVTAFGSAAERPELVIQSAEARLFPVAVGADDWRVEHVHLRGNGTNTPEMAAHYTLFHDVIIDGFRNCAGIRGSDEFVKGVFLVDFDCRNIITQAAGWQFFLIMQQGGILGASVEDGRITEGNIRFMHGSQVLVQHNFLDRAADNKQSITIRSCDALDNVTGGCSAGVPTRQIVVSDNIIHARTTQVIDMKPEGPHEDVIFERNFITYVDATDNLASQAFALSTGERVSVRNNIFQQSGGNAVNFVQAAVSPLWVYGNTVVANVTGPARLCRAGDTAEGECANNLVVSTGDAPTMWNDELDGGGNFFSQSDFEGTVILGNDQLGTLSIPPLPSEFLLQPISAPRGASVAIQGYNPIDFMGNPRTTPGGDVGALE